MDTGGLMLFRIILNLVIMTMIPSVLLFISSSTMVFDDIMIQSIITIFCIFHIKRIVTDFNNKLSFDLILMVVGVILFFPLRDMFGIGLVNYKYYSFFYGIIFLILFLEELTYVIIKQDERTNMILNVLEISKYVFVIPGLIFIETFM